MLENDIYLSDYYHQGTNGKLVFFIHGIFSSPKEFSFLYPILKENNYSIYAVLLKEHGGKLSDLSKIKYLEWVNQVNNTLSELFKKYENIYIFGHSMGGLLALNYDNSSIKKRILLAPALRVKLTRRYIWLGLNINKDKLKDKYLIENQKLISVEFPKSNIKKIWWFSKCFWQLFKLIKYTNKNLSNINKPLLIIQSYKDECVTSKAPNIVMKMTKSNDKRIVWLKKSYHAVLDENDKQLIIKLMIDFIERDNI